MGPPDIYEKGVRLGCGFFAGLVLYGLLLVIWFDAAGFTIALVAQPRAEWRRWSTVRPLDDGSRAGGGSSAAT